MKTSINNHNGKKGWSASLILAGLLFMTLMLTGCPQATVDKQDTGGKGESETVAQPIVSNLNARYDKNSETITVSWSATNAAKFEVRIEGGIKKEAQTVTEKSASFTGIQADDTTYTITVQAIAADGTPSDTASTTIKASQNRELTVIGWYVVGGTTHASGSGANISFSLGNQDLAGNLTMQLYQNEQPVDGTSTQIQAGRTDAHMTFPTTAGTYTVRLLNDGNLVAGAFATVTLLDPKVSGITLRKEVRPGSLVAGTLEGNQVLGNARLTCSITPSEGNSQGQISGTTLSFTAPSTEGDCTLTISWNGQVLYSTPFTVKADAALPSMDNPFAEDKKYVAANGGVSSWEVQGIYLIENESNRENWYTFTHDAANKRITLTPYKRYSLTRVESEAEIRADDTLSWEYNKGLFLSQLTVPTYRAKWIEDVKAADPTITGLEALTNEELIEVSMPILMKKNMGYDSWDNYIELTVQEYLRDFDFKTTYSYEVDSSTGSLRVTEWWEPAATFKTLYDGGIKAEFSFSSADLSISVASSTFSIRYPGDQRGNYGIKSVTGSTIAGERLYGNASETVCPRNVTLDYGAITDLQASDGSGTKKQMDVTYKGQSYTLTTNTLKEYRFTIQ